MGGFRSPGDYAALKFPPDSRQDPLIFLRSAVRSEPSARKTWNAFFAKPSPTNIVYYVAAILCGTLQTYLRTKIPLGGENVIKAVTNLDALAANFESRYVACPNYRTYL